MSGILCVCVCVSHEHTSQRGCVKGAEPVTPTPRIPALIRKTTSLRHKDNHMEGQPIEEERMCQPWRQPARPRGLRGQQPSPSHLGPQLSQGWSGGSRSSQPVALSQALIFCLQLLSPGGFGHLPVVSVTRVQNPGHGEGCLCPGVWAPFLEPGMGSSKARMDSNQVKDRVPSCVVWSRVATHRHFPDAQALLGAPEPSPFFKWAGGSAR